MATLRLLAPVEIEQKLEFIRQSTLKFLQLEPITRTEWNDLYCAMLVIIHTDYKETDKMAKLLRENVFLVLKDVKAKISSNSDDETFVKSFTVVFATFFKHFSYLAQPFAHLNCSARIKNDYVTRMMEPWHENIFPDFNPRVQVIVSKWIKDERNGGLSNHELVRKIRDYYLDLGSISNEKLAIYKKYYEEIYFNDTCDFYQAKAAKYLAADGVESYMKFAELSLNEEADRSIVYLHQFSIWEQRRRCADVLVLPFSEIILAECQGMLARKEIENLHRMYRLITLVIDYKSKAMPKELVKFVSKNECPKD